MTTKIVLNDFEMEERYRCETMHFDVTDIIKFSGPGVYVFYSGKDALYVGCGKCVMGRCMGIHHKSDVRATASRITVHPCKTHEIALRLEKKLIEELKPRYNWRKNEIDFVKDVQFK